MSVDEISKASYVNPAQHVCERENAYQSFDSFPYLSTRVFPALYNINLYPKGLPESTLFALARQQVQANKLPACLALGSNRALWFNAVGNETFATCIPVGGIIVPGKLRAPYDFSSDEGFAGRQERLVEYAKKTQGKGRYLVGKPANCVREATPADAHLGELCGGKIPLDLAVCKVCGDPKGECLYPESQCYGDKVWTLTCRCENDNICSACGEPLFHHKLDSCFYDRECGKIYHVAGYLALSHECGLVLQKARKH